MQALPAWSQERAQTQWKELDEHIQWCDERIEAHLKEDEQAEQASQLMGVGPVTASAVVATVGDFKQFKNGAQLGAWLGLTPKQNSSGGKNNLGTITKRGDMYTRMLLIQGAKAAVHTAHHRDDPISKWVLQLRQTGSGQTRLTYSGKSACAEITGHEWSPAERFVSGSALVHPVQQDRL